MYWNIIIIRWVVKGVFSFEIVIISIRFIIVKFFKFVKWYCIELVSINLVFRSFIVVIYIVFEIVEVILVKFWTFYLVVLIRDFFLVVGN